ncbi:winged helix-turn-helix transcriptional regulator [Oscillospiraceae bacterium HV4-5-C5C]|nr:winged helix-turn-helix transcriptional regulator [Oscillospiraceae bacterium HV4-5-C5C]
MNEYNRTILDLLLTIYEKIMLTEEEALLKGHFSDLSKAEMHTLASIGPYEQRTMGETAARLSITTGTLTVAVDRLVKKKYVKRERATNDRRIVLLSLTREGKIAYRMFWKFHTLLVDGMVKGLNDGEREQLLSALSLIDRYITDQYYKYNAREMQTETAEGQDTAKKLSRRTQKTQIKMKQTREKTAREDKVKEAVQNEQAGNQ